MCDLLRARGKWVDKYLLKESKGSSKVRRKIGTQ